MLRAMPNVRVVRPADALETTRAWELAIDPKSGCPWTLILTRQKLPYLGDRDARVDLGAYAIADADGTPDLVLIATGSEVSLAIDAKKILEEKGVRTRVVSMPSWELFEEQPQSYRDEIIPPNVEARMSIEAGSTFGWSRWVGDRGYAFGIDHYGTSAPASIIAKTFGLTPENIASVALDKFALLTR